MNRFISIFSSLLVLLLLGTALTACAPTDAHTDTLSDTSASTAASPESSSAATESPTDTDPLPPSDTDTIPPVDTEAPLETAPPLSEEEIAREVANYNYIIGTQAFSPRYQFTDKEPVFEIADCIVSMGSNAIKFSVASDDMVDRVMEAYPSFKYVFLWYRSNHVFRDGYSAEEAEADYTAIFNFTKNLLTKYAGSGTEFYIGHWEGDWYYLDNYNTAQQTVSDTVTQGMIDWMNNRQKAVDDAKAAVSYEGVDVFNYIEINRPMDAFDYDYDRVVNRVLPHTNVDYVSYSAYDSMGLNARKVVSAIEKIYELLPEKEGIEGPRVFIGEVGNPAANTDFDPELHKTTNLNNISKYLRADVKFILYWQMYCNEVLENGQIRGFWLINDKNEKQPLYYSFEKILADAKAYVETTLRNTGRAPTIQEYRAWLLAHEEF